jgi:hypothetical protein
MGTDALRRPLAARALAAIVTGILVAGLSAAGVGAGAPAGAAGIGDRVVAWDADGFLDVPDGLGDVVAVEAGWAHTVALRSDGTVVTWGDEEGTGPVPDGLTGVVAVSAGCHYSLALKGDGTVVGWGNHLGASVPDDLRDVTAISAGCGHGLALRADGTVVAWGSNGAGQARVPSYLPEVVAVSGGYEHSLALLADGRVAAWGGNESGEVEVPTGLSSVVEVDAGWGTSIARRGDGSVVAWGFGAEGIPPVLATDVSAGGGYVWRLPSGSVGGSPAPPSGLTGVTAVSAGLASTVALRGDGSWNLLGRVGDAATGAAIGGAQVELSGPESGTFFADAAGEFRLTLPTGTYEVTVRAFGYVDRTVVGVVIGAGDPVNLDIGLEALVARTVSGRVSDDRGDPVPRARVALVGTPRTTTTDADGRFRLDAVPEGDYDVRVAANRCTVEQTVALSVDGDEVLDVVLDRVVDARGSSCRVESPAYVEAANVLALSGDDDVAEVPLPFRFPFYGRASTTAWVSTNGFLNFLEPQVWWSDVPDPSTPNAAVYAFADDLYVDDAASVRTELIGAAPNRRFVIEWRNVAFCCVSEERLDVAVVLYENGEIALQYRNLDDNDRERGGAAVIGIEDDTGTVGLRFSEPEVAVLESPADAVRFVPPPTGFVQGRVTDANDAAGIAGATVRALRSGVEVGSTTTAADGSYLFPLPVGSYRIEMSAPRYVTVARSVTLDRPGGFVTRSSSLATARAVATPGSLSVVLAPGRATTATIRVANTGSAPMTWELVEAIAVPRAPVAVRERDPAVDPNARTARGLRPAPVSAPVTGAVAATAAGDVLAAWTPAGLSDPWSVGYTGAVWSADALVDGELCGDIGRCRNVEFDIGGSPTGRSWPVAWDSAFNADMAYDTTHGVMCQVAVGGDNGIHCWDPDTGAQTHVIAGDLPWTQISQRGLAYRAEDDTFWVGGWNEGVIYRVSGLSSAVPGTVLGSCSPPDPAISGLAWNGDRGVLWQATNSETDTLYALDPDTCEVRATLGHPDPGYNGGGLDTDEQGNLWMVSQARATVYLVDSGLPAVFDVPWMAARPTSGTIAPGAARTVTVRFDTAGLDRGVHQAALVLRSNSGRQPSVRIPVTLTVRQVALVTGNAASLPAADRVLVEHLTARGWPVVTVDDNALATAGAAAAFADADAVVVSSSVDPGLSGHAGVLRSLARPIVLLEPYVARALGLVTAGAAGEISGQTSTRIWRDHPLAAGLPLGVHRVARTATTFGWFQPVGSATVVATQPGTARTEIFALEAGRPLTSGLAPARRVGFFFTYPTAAAADATGWRLFDAAVAWAADAGASGASGGAVPAAVEPVPGSSAPAPGSSRGGDHDRDARHP